MEPTVQSPRIEPAISADRFERPVLTPKTPKITKFPNGFGGRNPLRGTEFLDAETRRLNSAGETASVTGDRKCGTIAAEIPTETVCFHSAPKSAVWSDWMLPTVFQWLEELAKTCRARHGSLGAFIEDKNSGTILLQQAARRGWQAHPIESKLTAMGKDERAISVSGYVHQEKVKYTDHAFNKITTYKRRSRNHLVDQIENFRVGDKDNKREDDLLDTFCYGIALSLGDRDGF
jgi:hypothetical protein